MPLAMADNRDSMRRYVYWTLILASALLMVGRAFTAKSNRNSTAMLSANDRSRWATIRSLVDDGTYAIDNVVFRAPGKRDPDWYTIDMVRHRARDEREHYYSSKPTLLSTVLAAPYWLIKSIMGLTLAENPFPVMRMNVMLTSILPMVGYLVVMMGMVERLGTSDVGRIFVMAAAAFATPLTTFAITLNNHGPAAMGVLAAIWAIWQIWHSEKQCAWHYALAGLASAWAATCDLPALSFFAMTAAALSLRSPAKTLLAFAPPAALVFAAAVGTNYLAHGVWSTPYAHRKDGPVVATIRPAPTLSEEGVTVDESARQRLAQQGITLSPAATIAPRAAQPGYVLWDPRGEQRFAVETSGGELRIRIWDHWYDYEGTYWAPDKKKGVDLGEPSRWVYSFHAILGHHGVLSLTPIWLFSIAGVWVWLRRGDKVQRGFALTVILLTAVCLTFYIGMRPLEDRNYGGVSCCFRWTLWLVPLWLICLLPGLDTIADRPKMRWLAGALLLISIFSATYSNNPWSHPWLFDVLSKTGWIKY